VVLSSRTKEGEVENESYILPLERMGSKFETKALLFSELIYNMVALKLGITESEMKRRHSNFG
jgi:hypothetical protein